MFQKTLAFAAFALAVSSAQAGLLASFAVKAPMLSPATTLKFHEILANPDTASGVKDQNAGTEYIALKGDASASLDGWAIVVVENESGSTPDDRGTVKNIFPLDGYSTDSRGLFVIRDVDGSGNAARFTPDDPLRSAAITAGEARIQFQSTFTAASGLAWGGNTLENEGGNYFLVKGINTALVQKIEDSSGNLVSAGTALDHLKANGSNGRDGILDYTQGHGTTPWTSIEDAVYIPKEDGADGSTNYIPSSVTSKVVMAVSNDFTPDYFARTYNNSTGAVDGLGVVMDLILHQTTSGGVTFNELRVDTAEMEFTNGTNWTTLTSLAPLSLANLDATPGNADVYTFTDSSSVVHRH